MSAPSRTAKREAAVRGNNELTRLRAVLVAIVIFLVPTFSPNVAETAFRFAPSLGLIALLVLIVLAAPLLPVSMKRPLRNPAVLLAIAIPASMLVAALRHDISRSWFAIFFALGAAAVTISIQQMDTNAIRRFVAYPLLVTASIQGLLATAQLATGSALVPAWLAQDVDVMVIDGVARAQGTMWHVYNLAALGLLAIGVTVATRRPSNRLPLPAAIGVVISTSMVISTYSRSALLGIVAIVGVMIFAGARDDRSAYEIAGIIVVTMVVTAMFTAPGWLTRFDQSVADDLDEASLGRVTLTRQALVLIEAEPLLGVGPGGFVDAIEERGLLDEDRPFLVHSYPLAFAAENGLPAGIAFTVLLLLLGIAAVRTEPETAALFFAIVPFIVFDVLHYGHFAGQIMFGVWLGALGAAIRWHRIRAD